MAVQVSLVEVVTADLVCCRPQILIDQPVFDSSHNVCGIL